MSSRFTWAEIIQFRIFSLCAAPVIAQRLEHHKITAVQKSKRGARRAGLPIRRREARASFPMFPNDWQADQGLRTSSLGARGLWFEMICLMHKSPRYGFLQMPNGEPITDEQLAALVNAKYEEVSVYLLELKRGHVYSLLRDRKGMFCVVSRKMIRDYKKRQEWRKQKENQQPKAQRILRDSPKNPAPPSPSPIPILKDLSTKNNGADPAPLKFELPVWVNADAWSEYERMRRYIRKPMTDYARKLAVGRLEKLRSDGQDPKAVLEHAVLHSNQGLWAIRADIHQRGTAINSAATVGSGPRAADFGIRPSQEAIERDRKRQEQRGTN